MNTYPNHCIRIRASRLARDGDWFLTPRWRRVCEVCVLFCVCVFNYPRGRADTSCEGRAAVGGRCRGSSSDLSSCHRRTHTSIRPPARLPLTAQTVYPRPPAGVGEHLAQRARTQAPEVRSCSLWPLCVSMFVWWLRDIVFWCRLWPRTLALEI